MKFDVKRISKKALSCVLAICIVLTTLMMAFTVFAQTPVYTVTQESPAIPMTQGTQINVSNLEVVLDNGTTVNGADLTWSEGGTSVYYADGYIKAGGIGTVKFEVSDGTSSATVYAVAVTAEDAANKLYKFYDADFQSGNYNVDEWRVNNLYSGTSTKNKFETQTYEEQDYYTKVSTSQTNTNKYAVDANGDYVFSQSNTKWDVPYINGNSFNATYDEAVTNGVITSNMQNYATTLGGFIPLSNGDDKEVLTADQDFYTVKTSNNVKTYTLSATRDYSNSNQSGGYVYTTNPIFNDFSNYTVGAKMLSVSNIKNASSQQWFGIIGRVTYGANYIKDYVGTRVNATPSSVASANTVYYISSGATHGTTSNWWTYGEFGRKIEVLTDATSTKATFSYLKDSRADESTTEFKHITQKYHGATMTLKSGDNAETVTVDAATAFTADNSTKYLVGETAGSIGFYSYMDTPLISEMYAAINEEYLETLPVSEPMSTGPSIYTVTFGSPAIPMYKTHKLNLNYVEVEFERDGTPVNGADISWSVAEGDNVTYNPATNYLSAYDTGISRLIATDKATGLAKNVYVVVAETGATEFNLLDYDFSTDAYVPEEWNYVYYNANGTGTYYSSDPTQSPAHIVNTGGYVKIGPNNNANNGGWINHGILMSANPMFKDFADYTVTTTAKAAKDNEWSGLGIVGRTNIDENGVLVTNKNMILSYVMGYGKTVRIKSNNAGWWAAAAETYGDEITPDDAFKGGDTAKHTITTKFDGENIVITRDTYEIFDLSKATDAIKTAWGNNKAVDAGAPGMMTWDLSSSFYTFKVSLNVDTNALPYMEDLALYIVANESPAIPMTVNTKINVNDLMVTFADGSTVAGGQLTWKSNGSGVVVDGGNITAKTVGTTALTVTNADKTLTRTVYVVAASAEDAAKGLYKFYNADFKNGNYNPSEWRVNNIFTGTSAKLGFKTIEQGGVTYTVPAGYTLSGSAYVPAANSSNWHFGNAKVDANGDYVAEGPANTEPIAKWVAPYVDGGTFIADYDEALSQGIITATMDGYVKKFGGWLPIYNSTANNETVKYYNTNAQDGVGDGTVVDVDGGEQSITKESQNGGFVYTTNPIFNDFSNYTVGAGVLRVDTNDNAYRSSAFGIIGRVTYGANYINDYVGVQVRTSVSAYTDQENGVTYISNGKINGTYQPYFRYGFAGRSTTVYNNTTDKTTDNRALFTYLRDSKATNNTTDFTYITQKYQGAEMTLKAGDGSETIVVNKDYLNRTDCLIGEQTGSIGFYSYMNAPLMSEMYAAINEEYLVNIPVGVEVKGYTVTESSPALPMTVLTQVAFDKFNVVIDGAEVPATAIKFTSADEKAIKVTDTGIAAYKVGATAITAEYNGKTTTIYAVVKEENDTEWMLYTEDFIENEIPENWTAQWYATTTKDWHDITSATALTTDTGTHDGVLPFYHTISGLVWKSHGVMYLNDDVVSAFSDYTVDVTTIAYGHNAGGSGIIGRVNTNDAGKIDTTSSLVGFINNNSTNWGGTKYSIPEYLNYADNKWSETRISGDDVEWAYGYNTKTVQHYTAVFGGTNGTFYSSDDMSNVWTAEIAEGKGTVGVVTTTLYDGGYSSWQILQGIEVKLNNGANDFPEYTEIDIYGVTEAAPAIPMNEFTVLDTHNFVIEMNGAYVLGSDVNFTLAESTTNIEIAGNEITAYVAGVYELTATLKADTSVKKTVYLAVKTRAEKQWTIYSADFDGNETHSDWKSMFNSSNKWGTFPVGKNYIDDTLPADGAYNFLGGTRGGFVPYAANYTDPVTGAVSADAWGGTMVFYTTNEMLNSFADFTVDMHFSGNSGYHGGYGILGRVNIDASGNLTDTTAVAGFNVNTSHQASKRGVYQQTAIGTVSTEFSVWDYTDTLYNASVKVLGNHYYTAKFSGHDISISSPKDNDVFTGTTDVTEAGSIAIRMYPIFDSSNGCGEGSLAVHTITVTLNNAEDELPEATEIEMYAVEHSDPVIVMYKNTSATLKKMSVQLSDGGETYLATDIEWNTNGADGITIANDMITAYATGTYKVTATKGTETKDIYVFVVNKGTKDIELFHEDFSSGVLDYNVWQQTEYYFGNPTQVTTPIDIKTVVGVDGIKPYVENVTLNQMGAIPFVTLNYWDAITMGGGHSREEAGGTGYGWNAIYMNNVMQYAYIRDSYVNKDGVKLSDLGVYDVSASMTLLQPDKRLYNEYTQSTDTYGNIRFEYNGVGLMGRIDFNGESFYNSSTSTMQNFIWDGNVIIKAGSASAEAPTSSGQTNTFGGMSLRASYRNDKITGTYTPAINSSGYWNVPSYTAELAYNNTVAGSVGFYSEGRDIDIYDFTVTYPVTEVFGANSTITPETVTEVSVPVNTTVDLSRYDFGKTLTSTRDAVGELDAAKNTFTAFTVGTLTVDGITFNVTDGVSTGGKKLVNIIGNGTAVVTPADNGKYTLTVTPDSGYVTKAGAVIVDGKIMALNKNTVTFAVDAISETAITVEFIAKRELGFNSMGATIRIAKENVTTGIRFGARINNIYGSGNEVLMDETIIIGGKEYKIKTIGSLLIPTVMLDGKELTISTPNVANTETTRVTNLNENYADIYSTLVNIPTSMYGIDMSFRGYIIYTNTDGTGEYIVYTDEIERSYNYVMKAAPVSETGIDYNVNNVSILLTANKQNIKYDVNEQITVYVDTYIDGTPANGIPLSYEIFSGNANGYSGSAIETGTLESAPTAATKITYTPETSGYYYIVVKAMKGESVVMTDTIRLGAGVNSANTAEFDENNIATTFGVISDTHVYEDMTHKHNQHLVSALKVLNSAAGYYADGTQKLDALLVAGDLGSGANSPSNYTSIAAGDTDAYFDMVYGELGTMRDIYNDYLGDTQLFYAFGNHDTSNGTANFIKNNVNYAKYSFGGYLTQIMSGKVAETTADKYYNPYKDYSDSKDYIKYFGRDEGTQQNINYGNRVMKVNGITFVALEAIGYQNGYSRYTDATLNFLRDALESSVANDPTAPVFIITHYRPDGTSNVNYKYTSDGNAVNIDDILNEYPQAILWAGHTHDILQSGCAIVQTRTVDENGNIVDNGFTSITTASIGYTSAAFGNARDYDGSQAQLVEVDANGNVRITRYLIDSSVSGQAAVTDETKSEIKLSDNGQYIAANEGAVTNLGQIYTDQNQWTIINAVDDPIRDEYEPIARSEGNTLAFASNSITASGKTVTFSKATPNGTLTPENMVVMYVAVLYDADGNAVETKQIGRNIHKYSNFANIPDADTYSTTFTNSGTKVVVTAYDAFGMWRPAESYPTLTLNVSF